MSDHPRSRGVYSAETVLDDEAFGSSPLARGLPRTDESSRPGEGIIPARAGFTVRPGASTTPTPDHPRSRGVYVECRPIAPQGRGSSPLARGLLQHSDRGVEVVGIIPARAGFTEEVDGQSGQFADHPRSRGVYLLASEMHTTGPGSSPLARGLHRGWDAHLSSSRIIPARAGFTSVSIPITCPMADHPRSRGVYPCCGRTGARPRGSSPLARGLPQDEAPAGA